MGLPEQLLPILGEKDPNLANVRAWLGEALLGLGRVEEAIPYLEAAHNRRLEQLGEDDKRTRHVARLLAR